MTRTENKKQKEKSPGFRGLFWWKNERKAQGGEGAERGREGEKEKKKIKREREKGEGEREKEKGKNRKNRLPWRTAGYRSEGYRRTFGNGLYRPGKPR